MMASDVTDFPDPDSPTSPSTSPASRRKLTSRTAVTIERPAPLWALNGAEETAPFAAEPEPGNSTVNPRTSSRGGTALCYLIAVGSSTRFAALDPPLPG